MSEGALLEEELARFRGHLAQNLMHFGRALRKAGLPIGSGQILDATRAIESVGVDRRDDVYWALASSFVRRREELVVFDEAFELFFRDPFALSQALGALLSRTSIPDPSQNKPDPRTRRVRDALQRERQASAPEPPQKEKKLDYEVTMAASAAEALRSRDFEKMSADEERRAREAIQSMPLSLATIKTRRLAPDARGAALDVRRTLKASLRGGLDAIPLRFRGPSERPPPLVAICDISGSMERYSRMVLHFLHALTRARRRVASFVFGTRLTNVTRWLRERDVDHALASVGREVSDWSGGTRIGDSLRDFNRLWARRVLGQGAVVLLITDGLERGEPTVLAKETERLQKSCRRLIWLNPLLRFEAFEPRARGVRAMIDHVDDLRTVHHLKSLEHLAEVLGKRQEPRVQRAKS